MLASLGSTTSTIVVRDCETVLARFERAEDAATQQPLQICSGFYINRQTTLCYAPFSMISLDSNLVLLALTLLLGLFILQSLFLALFFFQFNRSVRSVERHLTALWEKTSQELRAVQQVLDSIKPLAQKLPGLQAEVAGVLGLGHQAACRGDELLGRWLESLGANLREVSTTLDGAFSGFSRKTFQAHRAALRPVVEISALIRGAGAALNRLFSRPKSMPLAHPLEDQEIFI